MAADRLWDSSAALLAPWDTSPGKQSAPSVLTLTTLPQTAPRLTCRRAYSAMRRATARLLTVKCRSWDFASAVERIRPAQSSTGEDGMKLSDTLWAALLMRMSTG